MRGRMLRATRIDSRSALSQATHENELWTDFNIELMKQLFSGSEYADRYRKVHTSFSANGWTLDKEIAQFRILVAAQNSQLNSDLERVSLVPEASLLQASAPAEVPSAQNMLNGPPGNVAQRGDVQQTANVGLSGRAKIILATLVVFASGVVAAWLAVPGFLK